MCKNEVCISTVGPSGYGWDELIYNYDDKSFYIDSYSCGSIDIAETRYEGRKPINSLDALCHMIRDDSLVRLLHFTEEFDLDNQLEQAIKKLNQELEEMLKDVDPAVRPTDIVPREHSESKYYLLPNREVVEYFPYSRCYAWKLDGIRHDGYEAVAHIIEHVEKTRVVSEDPFDNRKWKEKPLLNGPI